MNRVTESSAPLSRDLVSKRAVTSVSSIAHMLGMENADNLTEEEIKEQLRDMMDSGNPVIAEEKGFCSTSMSPDTGYSTGTDEDDVGIEFVILNKKGTHGVNFTGNGSRSGEDELLLAGGTKFRLIKVFFNDGDPKETRKINKGSQKSWKIYMETIPQEEKGVER